MMVATPHTHAAQGSFSTSVMVPGLHQAAAVVSQWFLRMNLVVDREKNTSSAFGLSVESGRGRGCHSNPNFCLEAIALRPHCHYKEGYP